MYLRNEIDALIYVARDHTLLVVEAKSEARSMVANTFRNQVDAYVRSTTRSHLAKLARKVEDVSSNLPTVLHALAPDVKSQAPPRVIAVFVAWEGTPAESLDATSSAMFMTLDELAEFLESHA